MQSSDKFKEFTKLSFEKSLKEIIPCINEQGWYEFSAKHKNKSVVIMVKSYKKEIHSGILTKAMDLQSRDGFDILIMVSLSGYFDTVYDYLDNHQIKNVYLYGYNLNSNKIELFWSAEKGRAAKEVKQIEEAKKEPTVRKRAKKAKRINIGVFTSKGGVGKTTISAHLAGALSIIGYDVALIDLDPQSNLKKLIGDGGIYIKNDKAEVGNTLSVLSASEWSEDEYKEVKALICDCNPELDKNPTLFVKKFDFCIIPITLNPLGINKHASVVERTVQKIREKNKTAKFLILINLYEPKEGKKNAALLELLSTEIARLQKSYNDIELLDPSKISIRHSSQLFYWGMHALTKESTSELAFEKVGSRSIPKDDFFKLAEYVAMYASLI